MKLRAFKLFLATAAMLLASCGGGDGPAEPNIPAPVKYRTDLLYGYFGDDSPKDGISQLAETVNHVNVYFAAAWRGPDSQLAKAIEATNAGLPLILDIGWAAYGGPGQGDGDPIEQGEARMRAFFTAYARAGVINNIIAVYPHDEPDWNKVSPGKQRAVNAMLRKLFVEFNIKPKIAVTYTANGNWDGIETYDWVAFDNYGAGAKIFTNGDYERLVNAIRATGRSDMRIFLVPGGCDKWRQDPTQFFNKAQQDPLVIGIIPFIWIDEADPANGATKGIRSNGMAPAYIDIGLKIKSPPKS